MKLLIAVDDRAVSESVAGICLLMVTVAELCEPMVYASMGVIVTVRLPSVAVPVVGVEIVCESEAENAIVFPVELP